MNEIEIIRLYTTYFETFLTDKFSANGKGLTEKVNSINGTLPNYVSKKIKTLAYVRNQLFHEYKSLKDLESISSIEEFLRFSITLQENLINSYYEQENITSIEKYLKSITEINKDNHNYEIRDYLENDSEYKKLEVELNILLEKLDLLKKKKAERIKLEKINLEVDEFKETKKKEIDQIQFEINKILNEFPNLEQTQVTICLDNGDDWNLFKLDLKKKGWNDEEILAWKKNRWFKLKNEMNWSLEQIKSLLKWSDSEKKLFAKDK